MLIPKQLQSGPSLRILKHKEKTGHTKYTILGIGKNKKKHELNWQVIKCKECNKSIS